jgi:hypothetical protein
MPVIWDALHTQIAIPSSEPHLDACIVITFLGVRAARPSQWSNPRPLNALLLAWQNRTRGLLVCWVFIANKRAHHSAGLFASCRSVDQQSGDAHRLKSCTLALCDYCEILAHVCSNATATWIQAINAISEHFRTKVNSKTGL